MENTFKDHLHTVLKDDSRLWDEKSNELNETLLKDLIDKLDEKLIALLVNDPRLRERFFIEVNKVYVLRQNDLKFFIDENAIYNSYTKYRNRIGLRVGNTLLSERNEVVLDWPFKDSVLEGGMTREDQKRNEIFFNEVMARDEIDRLENPKALKNWKRYSRTGSAEVEEIQRDKKRAIRENMIIKGNNLLALHSLKAQFTGKIKLIYIDPPYNTGGDANIFTYNNGFKHSSWLTFMRNRLEVAKLLLRDDGFIAIAIDHYELFYLGVLADEVFGQENRIGVITVVHNPGGRQDDQFFSTSSEYMLVFAKNRDYAILKNFPLSDEKKKEFNLQDETGVYKLEIFQRGGNNSDRQDRPNLYYPIYFNEITNEISLQSQPNFVEILPIDSDGNEKCWRWGKEKVNKYLHELVIKKSTDILKIYVKNRLEDHPGEKAKTFWSKSCYAGQSGTNLLKKIIGRKAFPYPKSLYTVLDTLKITTDKNDIILDFFAGSGTTGHATLALNKEDGGNRKFILVEQLDDHIDICIERNQKVLAQENINDSFLYFELAGWNSEAKEKILQAKTSRELYKLFDELYDRYFLNYNIRVKEFKEKTLQEKEFNALALDKQKKLFVEMLDMNQMYVHASESEDIKFKLSSKDIKLIEKFYENKY